MFQLLKICSLLFLCCIANVNSQEKCEIYTYTINGIVYEEIPCRRYCCGFCDLRYCCELSEYRLNQTSCKRPENCLAYYDSYERPNKEKDCRDIFCCGSCIDRYCCVFTEKWLNQSQCSNDVTTKHKQSTTRSTTTKYNNSNNIIPM